MPANLNRKQQREIKAVVERAKKDNGIPQTAQQSIPFQRMFPDGICRVTDSYYTKTIQFQDINYQLAQQEDKTAIFDEWCSFLNFFDSSIHFELSFMNLSTDAESFEKSIRIPFKKDSFNPVRAEYSQMLKKQLAQGNNGLTKTKYLTFGIEAESMRQAKPRLNHIENDLLNNFRRLGVIATTMNGKERLHLMHSMFHMGDNDKFFFDWKYLVESGLSVKDFIAPTAFAFKTNRTFQMGSIFGSMSYLAITASDLSDRMLADFLDMESTQIVTMHIQSVDQTAAIKTIKRIITELDRSKIEEQKKAVRSGYDMDIIPSDLATYGKDAKSLLKELQSQNERMFMVTFLVLNTGRTEQELENNVFQAQSIAQKHNCNLRRLDFQQESGLMSSLPLAQNLIEIRRGLTTSSTAIFVPFTTQELFQNGGETLYYGLNALSNNLIMVDRKKLKNPNGLILGTPGSGKSFSAKREITNAFLVTDDDIIICDPEAEYAALVHKFNGQVVKISSSSTNYINPMDINLNYSEDDNPVALKADFILSLCELIMGSKDGLQPIEKTVIDRCVHQIYQRYFDNPAPENMPILEDLYDALLKQDEKEAHHVATALEIYVKGSLKLFNNRTNVDIQNRLVCFDIKELGNQLKKIGMLIVQDQVWGRVTANRSAGKSTRYYIDEFHLLLKEEQTATYSVEIWKRLDYTQNLYEKKLVTYPRTDSRFLTEDMAHSLTDLVKLAFHTFPVEDVDNIPVHAEQVVNNKKVTDHHAIIPTRELQKCNLSELPKGELAILQLISNRLCVAVGDPHRYAETVIELDCGGTVFSTKGKTVVQDGWKALVQKNDSTKSDENVQTLPSVSVGDEMTVSGTEIKEGKTSPPKHFTEDTLLSAMETAGADEMPDEVERKGLGTPATRAGIIEKLVRIGFLERKGDKKTKHLIPTHKGTALVTVMPEQIQSPSMTADWEEKLLLIEKGEYASEDFMDEIKDVIAGLIQNYEVIRDSEVMMSKEANSIGKCPLCGSAVEDKAKAFFCSNRACKFALWKNNRYFASIGKSMTSATAQKLLGSGKVKLKNCKSERTGNTFDATVFMEVSDDGKTKFSMEFENGGKRK